MKSGFPEIKVHFHHQTKRSRPPLSFCLVPVLFLALVLGSFHHHHDLKDHPDCAACAFVHHTDATAPAGPALVTIILPVLPVLFVLRVLTPSTFRPVSILRSRAPPA
jgi:hypothetical protein